MALTSMLTFSPMSSRLAPGMLAIAADGAIEWRGTEGATEAVGCRNEEPEIETRDAVDGCQQGSSVPL